MCVEIKWCYLIIVFIRRNLAVRDITGVTVEILGVHGKSVMKNKCGSY